MWVFDLKDGGVVRVADDVEARERLVLKSRIVGERHFDDSLKQEIVIEPAQQATPVIPFIRPRGRPRKA